MTRFKFCPLCGNTLTTKIFEQNERLTCNAENCDYIHWDNPVPVVAALIEHEEQNNISSQ